METLATVVRNVAVLVLMMLFLQLLLPEGKMERFVQKSRCPSRRSML